MTTIQDKQERIVKERAEIERTIKEIDEYIAGRDRDALIDDFVLAIAYYPMPIHNMKFPFYPSVSFETEFICHAFNALGATDKQSYALSVHVCEMENIESEASNSPEEGLDDDWDVECQHAEKLIDSVLHGARTSYIERSFPSEEFEDELNKRENDDY